ncbi:MAG: hypothetical protein ACK5LY_02055 [Lachnospirales bacterium]
MSLDNIDDLFNEQPLKLGKQDSGLDVSELDVEKLKKDLLKDEYKRNIEKQRFGLKKIIFNAKNFFANLDIKYYIMLLKIAVVILLLLFSYFMIMQVVSKFRGQNALKIDIEQPKTYVNNANNIYIDYPFFIDGEKNNLLKIQIDSLATKFYFTLPVDREKFTPILIDENGYYYIYDYDNVDEGGDSGEVIVFEGLRSGIENFRLIFVKDNGIAENTIDNVYFDFKMSEPIFKTPVKYYTDEFKLDTVGEHFDIEIQSSIFSSAKSEIYLGIEYNNPKVEYDFSLERIEESVYLSENGFKVPFKIDNSSVDLINLSLVEDNSSRIELGKLTFDVLKNLNSKIIVGFEDFHRIFKTNKELNLRDLFLSQPTENEIFDLEQYTVYFEGAKKYDDLLVLVAHGVDEEYETPYETVSTINEEGNLIETQVKANEPIEPERIEIIVDATLRVTLEDGTVETIEGVPIRDRIGTDIKFQSPNIVDATSSDMQLVVNKITVVEEGGEYTVDLGKIDSNATDVYKDYIAFVEESVTNRLKYMSNEILVSQLEGFSDEVLNDVYLSEIYKPRDIDDRANYAVDVKNYAIDNAGNFICVVTEEWYGREGNVTLKEYNKHHIIVGEVDGEMKIIYDKIIKE